MRGVLGVFFALVCLFSLTGAKAAVQIDIDLTQQSMKVSSASGDFTWPISSARAGYVTPNGRYQPYSLQRMHYSHKYHMSPMPYSIFFAGGYAIHGTYSVAQLGKPASHGCIRLSPTHAQRLFQLVKAEGASISIAGTPPHSTMYAKAKSHPHHYAAKATHRTYYATAGGYRTQGYPTDGYRTQEYRTYVYHVAQPQWGSGLAYAPSYGSHPAYYDVRSWQQAPDGRW